MTTTVCSLSYTDIDFSSDWSQLSSRKHFRPTLKMIECTITQYGHTFIHIWLIRCPDGIYRWQDSPSLWYVTHINYTPYNPDLGQGILSDLANSAANAWSTLPLADLSSWITSSRGNPYPISLSTTCSGKSAVFEVVVAEVEVEVSEACVAGGGCCCCGDGDDAVLGPWLPDPGLAAANKTNITIRLWWVQQRASRLDRNWLPRNSEMIFKQADFYKNLKVTSTFSFINN